jgi:hypothetical protein
VTNEKISLIDQECEGKKINGALLKDAVGIFMELDMDSYKSDFEVAMFEHTKAYYSRKDVSWILEFFLWTIC